MGQGWAPSAGVHAWPLGHGWHCCASLTKASPGSHAKGGVQRTSRTSWPWSSATSWLEHSFESTVRVKHSWA